MFTLTPKNPWDTALNTEQYCTDPYLLKLVINQLTPAEEIYVPTCGVGDTIELLITSNKFKKIYATDLLDSMINTCTSRFILSKLDKTKEEYSKEFVNRALENQIDINILSARSLLNPQNKYKSIIFDLPYSNWMVFNIDLEGKDKELITPFWSITKEPSLREFPKNPRGARNYVMLAYKLDEMLEPGGELSGILPYIKYRTIHEDQLYERTLRKILLLKGYKETYKEVIDLGSFRNFNIELGWRNIGIDRGFRISPPRLRRSICFTLRKPNVQDYRTAL